MKAWDKAWRIFEEIYLDAFKTYNKASRFNQGYLWDEDDTPTDGRHLAARNNSAKKKSSTQQSYERIKTIDQLVYFQLYPIILKGQCLLKYLLSLAVFPQNINADFGKAIALNIAIEKC